MSAPDPDDEDTLHPEDNVRLPDLDAHPAEVTMVVSADELARALESTAAGRRPHPTRAPRRGARPSARSGAIGGEDSPARGGARPDPHAAAVPVAEAVALGTVPTPEEAGEQGDADAEPEERASAVRLVIAGLVIIALSVAIIVLVLDALPR